MVSWNLVTQEDAMQSWDRNLFRLEGATYSQAFAWGEYRRTFGWRPYRWVATDEESGPVTMMQGLLRIYPGKSGLLWVPGGPVGDLSFCNDDLIRAVKAATGMKRLYCRIGLARLHNEVDASILQDHGWKRTPAPLLSGMSMQYDPSLNEETRLAACTRNWRHNLRRSGKYGLSIQLWENPDIDMVCDVYRSMQDHKQLAQQFSRDQLEAIFSHLGGKITLYRCEDGTGEVVSLRGCVEFGNRAWDMFAATSAKGRKLYASYALFWRLMQHCHESGIELYDMGGVDPKNNPGVYSFKKGTGAHPLEYLGEWEWASSAWLRWATNLSIGRRSGGL